MRHKHDIGTVCEVRMSKTVEFYRNQVVLNDDLVARIQTGWQGTPGAKPGDTVVIGARHLVVDMKKDLLPGCNIVLLADNLAVSAGASVSTIGTKEHPSPS